MKRILPLLLLAALLAPAARAASADVTGLVPTIWWDFETQPSASDLPTANKGSASITFTSEGTKSYQAGITNGWAVNTASFTPYSGTGAFSTAGNAFTVSLVMTLGSNPNGITWNLRNATASKDLIIRRGTAEGSLLVGVGQQAQASTSFLEATFPDGDAAWHLVSVVVEPAAMSLYVDGILKDSTTGFTLGSASGYASQMQFGSHLNGPKTPEAKGGGLVDDFRIHDAALTPAQMEAIAIEYGIVVPEGNIAVRASGLPTVGKNTFSTDWSLAIAPDDSAEAALVYGSDAALSTPTTNALGSALSAGDYTASLAGLSPGTTYWWKIVASNGVNRAETGAASFRTLDEIVPTDYARRIPAAISGYAGTDTLTNFPVLVKLAADAPIGFDYADCAEDGSDLRFATADGTMLSHEIESWDTNGTSLVWVKVPALAGTTTTFDLFYGANPASLPAVSPTDVWTRYVVVIHGGDALANAVGNGLAVAAGSASVAADPAAGMAGGGIRKADYNAKGVNVDEPSPKLSNAGRFSVSGWFKRNGNGGSNNNGTHILMGNRKSWNGNGEGFLVLAETGTRLSVSYKGGHTWTTGTNLTSAGFAVGDWGHVAFSYDRPGARLVSYLNGIQDNETDSPNNLLNSDSTLAYWTFGSLGNNSTSDCFRGDMDELRVFNGFASGDWIRAEHDTVADPAAFAVLSPAESTDPDLPRFGAVSASDANGVATFTVALAAPGFGGAVPTAVSVFYGTDGENWTELSLGSTNEVGTLTGTVSGLTAGVRYVWYAVATATSGGTSKSTTSPQRSFVARAFDPIGHYKSFTATVVYDGAPAENLPFLIRISEDGVNGFDYDDVTASRFEILDAGGQLLPYEIDTWNTNGESLVWTRLPVYENGATVTVRYGAPFANAPLPASDVWTGYAGVWHMNETYDGETAATGLAHDSSGNGLDATPAKGGSGNLAQMVSAPGVVGNARVNATSDTMSGNYLSVPSYDSLAIGDTFAVSGWFKATTVNGYPRLLSRKTAYNTDNGWELENGNGNAKAFSARGASGDAISLNTPSYDNAWVHIALVYNGTTLSAYANGAPCGSGAIAAATDNGKPLSIGNNSNGSERSLPGLYDEIRLLDATPSAAWIAADYHAMADGGAISFSAVSSSDTSVPVLGTPSVARNPDGSFTVSVAVSENDPASIACTIGGTDYAMTPADASLPTTYSAMVSGLAPGTYVASVHATATSGTSVSSTCPDAFHAGALAIVKISDADEGSLSPGVFRVSRADADSAGLPALTFDVAFSGAGLAGIADPGISTATIPAGAAYVDIAVTPIPNDAVNENLELVLTVSGAHVGQSSTASLTVVNSSFDLAVRYVATSGNDANSGGTPETPKKTIAAAVAALAPIAPTRTCTVHVAPGLYPITSPIVVTNAVRILGDDPDPSKVLVSNKVEAGYYTQDQRVFQLNHPDALVANLTMQRGQEYGCGGNFHIGSAGGMVSNCVVEAGYTRDNGKASGAWLDAGVVTHTVFRKNWSSAGSVTWEGIRAGLLQLNGQAHAENCLFVQNNQTASVRLINVHGSSVMRNCTIADSSLSKTNDACTTWCVLNIASGATVQNVVIAGVTNTIDGATCAITGTVANFVNGAFDGDATGLPAGTIVGPAVSFFRNYAASDYILKYQPKSGGPLYDKGADYSPLAAFDLSGEQKRKVGAHIDIGCYEGNAAGSMFLIK